MNDMKYYNYKKTIEIMKREGVKTAELGMLGDWFCTAEEVTIPQLEKMENGISTLAGISYSMWDIPALRIEDRTFDCFYTL